MNGLEMIGIRSGAAVDQNSERGGAKKRSDTDDLMSREAVKRKLTFWLIQHKGR
jgi:hypothetical protein